MIFYWFPSYKILQKHQELIVVTTYKTEMSVLHGASSGRRFYY